MTRTLVFLRHPPVGDWVRGLCYGRSDVPLRDAVDVRELLRDLAHIPFSHIFHSGLQRTASVAIELARAWNLTPHADARLQERDFGEWELQSWDAIYASTGDAMMGMLTQPETWRPPHGETTFEMRDRVLAWWADAPPTGNMLIVSHGGPIAAWLGTRNRLPVTEWPNAMPRHREFMQVITDNE